VNHKINNAIVELVETVKAEIKCKFGELSNQLKKITLETQPPKTQDLLKSTRKYFGTAISFAYEEHLRITHQHSPIGKENLDGSHRNQDSICIN
jgi:hypothetical protein